MIRVGTIRYNHGYKDIPSYEGFERIEVMTPSTKYGSIMENIWQFSKIYQTVPKTTQYYSSYDKTVIWNQAKEETHMDPQGEPNRKYWRWRKRGFAAKYAIRYPVGRNYRHTCQGTVLINENNEYEIVDYVAARKRLYSPLYKQLVKHQPQYQELLVKLQQGINLLIVEVDGPHQEHLDYYIENYGISNDFIDRHTMLATKKNLRIMRNDTKHPYGHGYCLADALLEDMA